MNETRTDFCDTVMELTRFMEPRDMFTGNTTIGAVITNAAFSKAEMNKIASMAQNAYARCINPVGTMADGDTIYAAAVLPADGEKPVAGDINLVGTMAAEAMSEAIHKAILSLGNARRRISPVLPGIASFAVPFSALLVVFSVF